MNSKILDIEERKNVLLISDHIGLNSGVGNMAKKIVGGTSHRINWYCLGGNAGEDKFEPAEVNPDYFDNSISDEHEVVVYPHKKYGNFHIIKSIIENHNIETVLCFGDPYNFYWVKEKRSEISKDISFLYYHVWDNLPVPNFNREFYNKFDWIGSISRLTYHIVNKLFNGNKSYIPHGVDQDTFYPITEDLSKIIKKDGKRTSEYQVLQNMEKDWLGENKDFVVFWCNRNIQRKNGPDVIKSFCKFVEEVSKEKDKFTLIMRTDHRERTGPNLAKVAKKFGEDLDIRILPDYVEKRELNWYYNLADVTMNISNREGFGLTTLESLMAGTPIITNVTGGLQDQCGFKNEDGEFLTEKEYEGEWGTNSNKKYEKCDEWAFPVWPTVSTISGTQGEPYCYDDYVSIDDVVGSLKKVYSLDKEERKRVGIKGRTYAMKYFESSQMVNSILNQIEKH